TAARARGAAPPAPARTRARSGGCRPHHGDASASRSTRRLRAACVDRTAYHRGMRRILAVLLLAGCSPLSYAFTPSVKGLTPKPDNCVIEVVTSQPSRDYQELGVLEYYN